jgi:hypothetical protein
MQIVTLQKVKVQAGVTYSSRDNYLTQLANGIEAEIFAYLGADTKAEVTASVPTELSGQADAILENAVLVCIVPRMRDAMCDIWKGGTLARMLFPYRVPSISGGETA